MSTRSTASSRWRAGRRLLPEQGNSTSCSNPAGLTSCSCFPPTWLFVERRKTHPPSHPLMGANPPKHRLHFTYRREHKQVRFTDRKEHNHVTGTSILCSTSFFSDDDPQYAAQ